MSRGPAIFTQADVTRALLGAKKAGFVARKAEIDTGGKIVLDFSIGASMPETAAADPFGDWEAKRDARRAQRNR